MLYRDIFWKIQSFCFYWLLSRTGFIWWEQVSQIERHPNGLSAVEKSCKDIAGEQSNTNLLPWFCWRWGDGKKIHTKHKNLYKAKKCQNYLSAMIIQLCLKNSTLKALFWLLFSLTMKNVSDLNSSACYTSSLTAHKCLYFQFAFARAALNW